MIIAGGVALVAGFFGLVLLFNFKANQQTVRKQAARANLQTPQQPVKVDASPADEPEPSSAAPVSVTTQAGKPGFGYSRIVFPLIVLAASMVLALIFLPQVTGELAFRFTANGNPLNSANRYLVTGFLIGAQVLLVAGGWLNGYFIYRVGASHGTTSLSGVKAAKTAVLSANMVALPQVILAFVLVYVYSFNVSGVHLMPVWLFVVLAMVTGSMIIIYNFVKITRLK